MIDNSNASDSSGGEVDDLLHKKEFGASLRVAREASGMSLTDVAQTLLISVDIIKALENSQADALPALTFTQGYIRSYARLLGVSADEVISGYIEMAPNSKQVLTPNSVLPAQKCCNDKVVKLISFSFLVIAIIVLVSWFSNTDFKIQKNVISGIAEFNVQQVTNADVNNTRIDNAKIENAEPNKTAVEKQSAEKDFIRTENAQALQVQSATNLDTEAAATTEQVDNEMPVVQDKLLLSALADSWCEIQDSTGKRLYYQLLNRGEEVELIGVAPFFVFLGNAPKVRVELNNKIIDFEMLINENSNIASLEISKDATVTSQASQ